MENTNIARDRQTYRTIRAACIEKTGQAAKDFDYDARQRGTQDGEGEPATPSDCLRGARELAWELNLDAKHGLDIGPAHATYLIMRAQENGTCR